MSTLPNNTSALSVMIAEDHELARYGLSLTLDAMESLNVVAEAENGQQALELAAQHHPDIVLMDIGMPVMDGITATQKMKEQFPTIKVVMLTSHKDEDEVLASLSAGADAYCMKEISVERLSQVLEMVMEGALWLDPAIAQVVLNTLPRTSGATTQTNSDPSTSKPHHTRTRYNAELTDREEEVLKLIVAGKSNKEIAQILNVTTHTAKAHVSNIIQKLAVDDRTQAAVKALQEGIVPTQH